MSLPLLLLVDDSEAILSYEKAALAGLYLCATALDGNEALAQLGRSVPAAVLLDLSMPGRSGDQVLAVMKADPALRDIPVIIVSSEHDRAQQCLSAGAAAFLPKPIRADELRALVARILDEATSRKRASCLAVLTVGLGPVELGLLLTSVRSVELMPATRHLDVGPSFLSEVIDYHGHPVCVLDMARTLRIAHTEPLPERKLVIVSREDELLALCFDRVLDPEEIHPQALVGRDRLATDGKLLGAALTAIAVTPRGLLPIVDPAAFFSRGLLRQLPRILEEVKASTQREAPGPQESPA